MDTGPGAHALGGVQPHNYCLGFDRDGDLVGLERYGEGSDPARAAEVVPLGGAFERTHVYRCELRALVQIGRAHV